METKTAISKKINTCINHLNKYAGRYYSEDKFYRLACPEDLWHAYETKPVYMDRWEEECIKEYEEVEDDDYKQLQGMRNQLQKELVRLSNRNFCEEFETFVSKHKLEECSILKQLRKFFVHARLRMKFESTARERWYRTYEKGADRYSIMRVILYVLHGKEDEIVAYAEGLEDQELAMREINKFFVVLACDLDGKYSTAEKIENSEEAVYNFMPKEYYSKYLGFCNIFLYAYRWPEEFYSKCYKGI